MQTTRLINVSRPAAFMITHCRILFLLAAVLVATLGTVSTAAAHAHYVTTGYGEQVVIAGGQNHNGFALQDDGTYLSCEGNPLPGEGSAGYGLETAHHGPDTGAPGKGDGCYQMDGHPADESYDTNPAID